jgi:glycosyltransferase involved in cell wall biosynthesis
MSLTIVSIAYPLVPISCETVGGTEQVVAMLDEALVKAGHRSIVVAPEGSRIAGELVVTPSLDMSRPIDNATWDWAYGIHRDILRDVLKRVDADVVHMHGVDFHTFDLDPAQPILTTLHLPRFNYPEQIWRPNRDRTYVSCVSDYQLRQYPRDTPMIVIPNGVPLERFRPGPRKEDFALTLGRIVPEKGFHLALDAAKMAGLPLILAGTVPPFAEAQGYFEQQIRPRLDAQRRFVGPLKYEDRLQLLAAARCVIVPSLVDESNPLVVMEALASGTPVVARPVGAIPENVEHRRTGFLVEDNYAMAQALHEAVRILDPADCRKAACERFSADRMSASYMNLYGMIAGMGALEGAWLPSSAPAPSSLAHP